MLRSLRVQGCVSAADATAAAAATAVAAAAA